MAKSELKRSLSTPVLALYGLGNILGAGIYVLIGKVAGAAGTNAPLAFLIAMAVAGLTAFSYMELSSRFPKSAGSALYTFEAFKNKWLSLVVGFSMVLAGITSAAALAQGFAGYLSTLIAVPEVAASVGVLVILSAVALYGISESAKLAVTFTIIEAAGLLAIIWFGLPKLNELPIDQTVSLDPAIGMSGLLLGAFLAFYAFIGFEDMVNVAEEAKNPARSMPIAILVSFVVATVLYILVVLVSLAAATPGELSESNAPLSLVIERVSSLPPATISLIGMAAAFNGIIVQLVMGSRMLYGMSRIGWLTPLFAVVSAKRRTPTVATFTVSALMIAGTLLLPLISLASLTSYLVLGIFCLVNISLIVIKRSRPKPRSVLQVPIILPVFGGLSALAVIVYQLFA